MREFPVGVDVKVVIPLADPAGNPIAPTGLSYQIEDESGQTVVAPTEIDIVGSPTEVEVFVPAESNQLSPGAIAAMRRITLTVNMSPGAFIITEHYLLRDRVRLVVPTGSFQTLEQAMLVAATEVPAPAFSAAGEFTKVMALQEAYRRLTRFGYRMSRPEDIDYMRYDAKIATGFIRPIVWQSMELDLFMDLPAPFRQALCRAQVAEANDNLTENPARDRMNAGLLSETIGESSMMFRSIKPMDLGVSRTALRHLAGYIEKRFSIARA